MSGIDGFKGVTVAILKKLFLFLGVLGPRPITETPLVLALLRHIFGARATPFFIEDALSARHRRPEVKLADMIEHTNIFEPEVAEDLEEDIEDEEVRRQFEELRARRAKEVPMQRDVARKVSELMSVAPAAGASSSLSAGSAAAPAKLARARVFRPVAATGWSQAEAQQWLPPGFSLSKGDRHESRWWLRGRMRKLEVSKSFGRLSAVDGYGPMTLLIERARRLHTEATGEPCPFAELEPTDENT